MYISLLLVLRFYWFSFLGHYISILKIRQPFRVGAQFSVYSLYPAPSVGYSAGTKFVQLHIRFDDAASGLEA